MTAPSDARSQASGWHPAPGWLPEGARLYAIGDIHGRLDLLRAMVERIDADMAARPCAAAREIYLGDYIDRGPESAGVLDLLTERAKAGRLRALAGNHEALLLAALADPANLSEWLAVGGEQTLLSYRIAPPPRGVPSGAAACVESLRRAMPAAHRAFLEGLELAARCFGYFFAHAGVRPGVPLESQAPADLIWIRKPFLASEQDFGAVVVHGHTPRPAPEIRPNRINIDTGAWMSGRLSCLVLEGRKLRFLDAGRRHDDQ